VAAGLVPVEICKIASLGRDRRGAIYSPCLPPLPVLHLISFLDWFGAYIVNSLSKVLNGAIIKK